MEVNLSREVIGAAIDVHRALGPGLLESAYQACMCRELSLRQIPFRTEVDLPIAYKGCFLTCGYRIDIVVDDRVILELKSVESYADSHDVPWLEWAYCACGDPTGSGRTEALVYNPRHAPRARNVNHTTLPWLDEPYPLRTAGTPQGYSFDHATSIFRFRYSTRSPVTGRRSHAKTVIYTSPLHYPRGYRVRLSGARTVHSGPHRLVIRARRSARTVTVTLHPA